MLKTVILAENPLDASTWETFEVEDVCEFLATRFESWPATGRIYNEQVAECNDVTPRTEAEVERLQSLNGPFYCVIYPADPVTIIWVAVVAIIAIVAVTMAAKPTPSAALRNTQDTSPNNELAERTNKPRPNGRIPDIFGTVRSTPDLLAVPYKIFENNEEVEYSYMCIGRGAYEVSDIRDDTTLAADIAGTSVEVYSPHTSPNSGHSPQYRVGSAINTPVLNAKRNNAVNGQVLRAPNDQNIRGNQNIRFASPNEIQTSSFDFTDKFAAGDSLTLANAVEYEGYVTETKSITANSDGSFKFEIPSSTLPANYIAGREINLSGALFSVANSEGAFTGSYSLDGLYFISSVNLVTVTTTDPMPPFGTITTYYCRVVLDNPSALNPQWSKFSGDIGPQDVALRVPTGAVIYDLSGVYTVLSVSSTTIVLSNPSAVNSDWDLITTTIYLSPVLSTSGPKWIGPFTLDVKETTDVYVNFVALNGLYKDDGKNQYRFDIGINVEITRLDDDGNTVGSPLMFHSIVEGSATYKGTRAKTLKASLGFTGRCQVRAYRTTFSDLTFEGSVIDEVKMRDLYSMSPVLLSDFGNVTTVQSVTYATSGALALKERKLNMLVTRLIPARLSNGSFSEELYATNRIDDIISAICLDKYIGNRSVEEVDFNNIYSTIGDVASYFGTYKAVEFCYTFDKDNLSFEETMSSLASAVFCTAYRRGNVIRLSFEKETEDSTLLFNHRNKIPNSETRSISFGYTNDNDGIEFEYVSPEDDAIVTYYIPSDKSAANPKKIESIGIRNSLQAHFHAWRAWNKIRYQNVAIEFDATQEADLLVLNDRILVADNTRPDTQDGEIVSQNGLELKLSQPIKLIDGVPYAMFLQLYDGTVESVSIAAGSNEYSVILNNPPRLPLALNDAYYAKTTYIIVGNNDKRQRAFLVTEKSPKDNFTSTVRAGNYDFRFYERDKDFINGIVY